MNKLALLLSILSGWATIDLALKNTFDIIFWIALGLFIIGVIWLIKSDE